jgi:hypothetical protein
MNTVNKKPGCFDFRYHPMRFFTLFANQSMLRKARSLHRTLNRIQHPSVSNAFHLREAHTCASSASTSPHNRTITRASASTPLVQLPPGGEENQE